MVRCLVRMYLDSPSRLVLLEKTVDFHALPRTGEWLKLANSEMGDYFAFRVAEVTHREGSLPELMLDRLSAPDGKSTAFDEDELDEYVTSYLAEGWQQVSSVPNRGQRAV